MVERSNDLVYFIINYPLDCDRGDINNFAKKVENEKHFGYWRW